ncbi:MAG: YkgJ family cysteine cluster protein [Luteibacter sp.]|uniref:YkgJ family cysteine cluster protein n=1 Tax=Luteibacter sp. TaxID=1886636 RepID=UPI00280888A6|nr:YkgJ family cysteine cluster protein [Luteibacter sp.]MDQ7995280.1 YkgJ family cysteine cluster protein [Luteibacter sp.]
MHRPTSILQPRALAPLWGWVMSRWRTRVHLGVGIARVRGTRHRAAARLADSAHEHFDSRAERLGTLTRIKGKPRTIACKAGCSFCCSLYVSATASELLLIEGYIAAMPRAARLAVTTRVTDAFAHAQGKTMLARDRARVPCPMLNEQGLCGIYPVRPLTCRSYVSFDLPGCRADAQRPGAGTQVIRSGSLVELRSSLFDQLITKEREHGFAVQSYELIQGLHHLLSRPTAIDNMCRGIDSLAEARSR